MKSFVGKILAVLTSLSVLIGSWIESMPFLNKISAYARQLVVGITFLGLGSIIFLGEKAHIVKTAEKSLIVEKDQDAIKLAQKAVPPPLPKDNSSAIAKASSAFNRADYQTSFQAFQKLSAENPNDQLVKFWLARHYLDGRGTAKNLDKAITAYRELSQVGMNEAYVWAAIAHERRGHDNDVSEAMKLYEKSLKTGVYATSAVRLAQGHQSGVGVEANLVKSIRYQARAYIMKVPGLNLEAYQCRDIFMALEIEKAIAEEAGKTSPANTETDDMASLTGCLKNNKSKAWKKIALLKIVDYINYSTVSPNYSLKQPPKGVEQNVLDKIAQISKKTITKKRVVSPKPVQNADPTAISAAVASYGKADYKASFQAFQKLSAAYPGDHLAKFWLARHYQDGRGTAKDLDKAITAYTELGTDGMDSANVWAATAREQRGHDNDVTEAMKLYQKSMKTGVYATSAVRLAQGHQNGIGIEVNKTNSVRYLARAHIMKVPASNLDSYGCRDIFTALKIEKAIADEIAKTSQKKAVTKSTASLVDCIRKKEGKDWKQIAFLKIVDYINYSTVLPDYSLKLPPKGLARSASNQTRILPPHFDLSFAIASDSDSQSYQHAVANQSIMHQNYGLAISTSSYVTGQTNRATSSFFTGHLNPENQPFGQSKSELPDMLRLWHRGWVDHIHGWSDAHMLASHHFSKPRSLASGLDINIGVLFSQKTSTHKAGLYDLHGQGVSYWTDQKFGVIRLFFDKQPPHDTVYKVSWPPYTHHYDVNAWKLFSHKVSERGKDVYLVELPVNRKPAATYHSVEKDGAMPKIPGTDAHISASAKSCDEKKCAVKLLAVELDPLGKNGMATQAEWLKYFNIHPIINTAHGGERLASFATRDYVESFRKADKETDTLLDKTYVWMGLPLAALPNRKFYIQNILEDFGIRDIRPFQMKSGAVMLQFGIPAKVSTEFGNMTNLVTAWAGMKDTTYPDKEKFLKWAKKSMNLTDSTAKEIWKVKYCGFEQGGWLMGIIEASQRTKFKNRQSGEIWYTHFATICKDDSRPRDSISFSQKNKEALSRLSRLHYGLGADLEKQGFQRLWVLPPSAAMRLRILEAEFGAENVQVKNSGGQFQIQPVIGMFSPEMFPRPGLESRDLNGLTLAVSDPQKLASTKVMVGKKELKWLVKDGTGKKGAITVLDISEPYSLLNEISWPSSNEMSINTVTRKDATDQDKIQFSVKSGAQPHCFRPYMGGTVDNISAVGMALHGVGADDTVAIEFKTARHDGSVIVTNRYQDMKQNAKYKEHTILSFDIANYTPDQNWQNYLVPTYQAKTDLSQPIRSMADVPLIQGRLEEVCIHYRSKSGADLQIDHLSLYRYVTANRLPTDPIAVGGMVNIDKANSLNSDKVYFVRITGKSGKPQYARVGADGFYLAKIKDGAQVLTVELLGHQNNKEEADSLQKRKIHIVKSEIHVDFDLGAAQ